MKETRKTREGGEDLITGIHVLFTGTWENKRGGGGRGEGAYNRNFTCGM